MEKVPIVETCYQFYQQVVTLMNLNTRNNSFELKYLYFVLNKS